MNLIICLDNKNGISFAGRRQSLDRVLAGHIVKLVKNSRLWMHPYSASFFPELPENAILDPEYHTRAAGEDYCFAETDLRAVSFAGVRSIIVYRWNRVYPADVHFPAVELEKRQKTVCAEFEGSSHDRITQEIYRL